MQLPRFALSTGSGYRIARWFGRALSVASLWPIWYAFFGKIGFDWEAMLFGAPALIGGLWLWRWGGYRLRNPRDYLEIDRAAGVARLVRHDAAPVECKLDELGRWSVESWTTTHVNKGTRTTLTWYGVCCPGFGRERLFVADEADACRRWSAQVDAVACAHEPPGWDYSGLEVEAVLARHGLGDRNALLWTATGLAPAGVMILDSATLEAAARSLTHTTAAARVAERLDDATSVVGGMAQAFLNVGVVLFAGIAIRPLMDREGELLELAILAAIGLGFVCFGWRGVKRPVVGAIVAGLAGVAFVGKPWYAPVLRSDYGVEAGAAHALSPTSETHLYYVIPGALLLALAFALLSTIQVRKRVVPTSGRGDAIDLAPPRPEPPQPPAPE